MLKKLWYFYVSQYMLYRFIKLTKITQSTSKFSSNPIEKMLTDAIRSGFGEDNVIFKHQLDKYESCIRVIITNLQLLFPNATPEMAKEYKKYVTLDNSLRADIIKIKSHMKALENEIKIDNFTESRINLMGILQKCHKAFERNIMEYLKKLYYYLSKHLIYSNLESGAITKEELKNARIYVFYDKNYFNSPTIFGNLTNSHLYRQILVASNASSGSLESFYSQYILSLTSLTFASLLPITDQLVYLHDGNTKAFFDRILMSFVMSHYPILVTDQQIVSLILSSETRIKEIIEIHSSNNLIKKYTIEEPTYFYQPKTDTKFGARNMHFFGKSINRGILAHILSSFLGKRTPFYNVEDVELYDDKNISIKVTASNNDKNLVQPKVYEDVIRKLDSCPDITFNGDPDGLITELNYYYEDLSTDYIEILP